MFLYEVKRQRKQLSQYQDTASVVFSCRVCLRSLRVSGAKATTRQQRKSLHATRRYLDIPEFHIV